MGGNRQLWTVERHPQTAFAFLKRFPNNEAWDEFSDEVEYVRGIRLRCHRTPNKEEHEQTFRTKRKKAEQRHELYLKLRAAATAYDIKHQRRGRSDLVMFDGT